MHTRIPAILGNDICELAETVASKLHMGKEGDPPITLVLAGGVNSETESMLAKTVEQRLAKVINFQPTYTYTYIHPMHFLSARLVRPYLKMTPSHIHTQSHTYTYTHHRLSFRTVSTPITWHPLTYIHLCIHVRTHTRIHTRHTSQTLLQVGLVRPSSDVTPSYKHIHIHIHTYYYIHVHIHIHTHTFTYIHIADSPFSSFGSPIC
jgi:hypothetical protein